MPSQYDSNSEPEFDPQRRVLRVLARDVVANDISNNEETKNFVMRALKLDYLARSCLEFESLCRQHHFTYVADAEAQSAVDVCDAMEQVAYHSQRWKLIGSLRFGNYQQAIAN